MNPSEINLFPQASIFAGAPGINASTIQNWTRQNVQTLYLAWKETKDMAQLWLQKYRVFGTCPFSMETSTFGWPHRSLCGAGSIVSAWRGWLNLNCYQILPETVHLAEVLTEILWLRKRNQIVLGIISWEGGLLVLNTEKVWLQLFGVFPSCWFIWILLQLWKSQPWKKYQGIIIIKKGVCKDQTVSWGPD